ncbi:hypothetical protein Taro_049816 [Colocasia esculenta]|uniref:Uncharacterized protein n=1 Tax=Colocasia esculenta TaxID=4460 RepID=A0A843XC25_COLES|nr:hypothetical protein [Colocasia esculenta]
MELPSSFDTLVRSQPSWVLLLAFLGSLSVFRSSLSLLQWLCATFLRPHKNLRDYGAWAVVTGSTDGIGRALAFQLARQGLNLVLVGRNAGKLKEVSSAIKAEVRTSWVETVVADFAGDLEGGIGRLKRAIRGMDVGVLVNNAGTTYPEGMYMHEVGEEMWGSVVKVNMEGLTKVTRAVLPGMLQRKRGAVVNIGSGSSVVVPSHPLFAVYAATKAYVDSFSRSLHAEYKKKGIHVQCQIPLYVATKMVPFKRPSLFTPTPEEFARWATRFMGYEPRCMPYWPHYLQWCLIKLLPESAINEWRLRYGLSRRKTHDRC